MHEESIKILQRSIFQWILSWKWNHAYLCNMHGLTSQFVSGFIGTGYLLFGGNHLVIFILVSVCYVFSIFYNIFRICIFVAFFCVQPVAFCGFLLLSSGYFSIFTLCSPHQLSCLFFCQFLGIFLLPLVSLFFVFFAVFLQHPLSSFCSFILVKVIIYYLEV